jgi:hypothetical protein
MYLHAYINPIYPDNETISDKPRERMAVTFNLEPSVPGGQVIALVVNGRLFNFFCVRSRVTLT